MEGERKKVLFTGAFKSGFSNGGGEKMWGTRVAKTFSGKVLAEMWENPLLKSGEGGEKRP